MDGYLFSFTVLVFRSSSRTCRYSPFRMRRPIFLPLPVSGCRSSNRIYRCSRFHTCRRSTPSALHFRSLSRNCRCFPFRRSISIRLLQLPLCLGCRLLLHLLLIRSGRRCKRRTEGIHAHLNTHKAVHGSVWVGCCFLHTACHRSLYIALTDRWIRHHRTFVAHLDQFLGSFIVGKACDCHGLDLHAAHCPPALIHRICHVAGQLGALGCCERNADAVGCHLIDRGLQAL